MCFFNTTTRHIIKPNHIYTNIKNPIKLYGICIFSKWKSGKELNPYFLSFLGLGWSWRNGCYRKWLIGWMPRKISQRGSSSVLFLYLYCYSLLGTPAMVVPFISLENSPIKHHTILISRLHVAQIQCSSINTNFLANTNLWCISVNFELYLVSLFRNLPLTSHNW